MKKTQPRKMDPEIACPACGGTGFPPVIKRTKPGRKIYPARCKQCLGKGRVPRAAK
jgi:DnaJ-class molecular chaperone